MDLHILVCVVSLVSSVCLSCFWCCKDELVVAMLTGHGGSRFDVAHGCGAPDKCSLAPLKHLTNCSNSTTSPPPCISSKPFSRRFCLRV